MANKFSKYRPDKDKNILDILAGFLTPKPWKTGEGLSEEEKERRVALGRRAETPTTPKWLVRLQDAFEEKAVTPLYRDIEKYEARKAPIGKLAERVPKPLQTMFPILQAPEMVRKAPGVATSMLLGAPEERAEMVRIEKSGTPEERKALTRQRLMQTAMGAAFLTTTPIETPLGKMTPKTARSILKVKKGASRQEVQQAYRSLIKKEYPRTITDIASKYKTSSAKLVNTAKKILLGELDLLQPQIVSKLPGRAAVQAEIPVSEGALVKKPPAAEPVLEKAGALAQRTTPRESFALEGTPLGTAMEAERTAGGGLFAEPEAVKPTVPTELEPLDEVKGLIFEERTKEAHDLWKTIPEEGRLDFKAIEAEVGAEKDRILAETAEEIKEGFGEHKGDIDEFKKILRIAGEKKAKTGEGLLFREHIPKKGTRPGSDEVAEGLGMTENEFMEMLQKEVGVGKGRVAASEVLKIRRQATKKAAESKIKIDRGKIPVAPGQEMMPGTTVPYHAEPTAETLAKIEKGQTEALKRTAKQDYKDWEREVARGTRPSTPAYHAERVAKAVKESTVSPLSKNIEELKDIGIGRGWADVYQNFEQVYGKRAGDAYRIMLDPWDIAKSNSASLEIGLLEDLDKNIVGKYGFKRKSKESKAIQEYGTGIRDYNSLVTEFGKETADNVVEADKWFRTNYDSTLGEANRRLKAAFPNDPDKLIPRREDYYRHFHDVLGFKRLLDIFENPAGIDPKLVGISDFTEPKVKWLSIAQKRLGLKTEYDAIGGYLDYIPQIAYATHINPEIQGFRQLKEELAEATSDPESPVYGKLNNFIEYLGDHANDLAGKTDPLERGISKILPFNRKGLRVLDWINRRAKANVILLNVSASIAQSGNIPQGIASAGEKNFLVGGIDGITDALSGNKGPMSESPFLKERYLYKYYRKFDVGIIEKSRDFAEWMTIYLDEAGTRMTWLAHLKQAQAGEIPEPLKEKYGHMAPERYADVRTRFLVSGRGIGEIPLAQKSVLTQFFAPFQLEVAKAWWVMHDFVTTKQFGKLIKLFAWVWLFNSAYEQIMGRRVLFDPIDAFADALSGDKTPLERAGRIGGEALSNVPFGMTAAAVYPEYGATVPGTGETLTREELFGEADPTRFGGETLMTRAIQKPLTRLVPPFGGVELEKMIKGVGAVGRGYSESKGGSFRFPVSSPSIANLDQNLQTVFLGEYSTPEARFYFKEDLRPLSDNQLLTWKSMVSRGRDPVEAWTTIYIGRLSTGLTAKIGKVAGDPEMSHEEKREEITKIKEEHNELITRLREYGKSEEKPFSVENLFQSILGGIGEGEMPAQGKDFGQYTPD